MGLRPDRARISGRASGGVAGTRGAYNVWCRGMTSTHELLRFSALEDLRLGQFPLRFHTLVVSDRNPLGKRAVLKAANVTPCEVHGYLLAKMFDLPVPPFQGLWFDDDFELPGGSVVHKDSVGVLIEFIPNLRPVSRQQLVRSDKRLAAKYLVLCFFDRHEWPEVFRSGELLYLLDLERLGPVLLVDEFGSALGAAAYLLESRRREYRETSKAALLQMLKEADDLGIREEVEEEFRGISLINKRVLAESLLIGGHPHSANMSALFLSAISDRQRMASRELDSEPWPDTLPVGKVG